MTFWTRGNLLLEDHGHLSASLSDRSCALPVASFSGPLILPSPVVSSSFFHHLLRGWITGRTVFETESKFMMSVCLCVCVCVCVSSVSVCVCVCVSVCECVCVSVVYV